MSGTTHRWRVVSGAAAIAVAALGAWSGGAAAPAETVLAVPGRSNANPSIAAAGATVAVAWVASGENARPGVYVATSADAGETFGRPVLVSGAAGADVSGEQPPRVALRPQARGVPGIVVIWTAKAAAGTRLLTARSDDGGRRFTAPAAVPGSEAAGNRGWESLAVTPRGDVWALWLDHRELAAGRDTEHSAHQHGATRSDGAERAQRSRLFVGSVSGGAAGRGLTGGVCYCCKTALAAGPDGGLYAAWRHVYPGNIRDIAFTMSSDGGATFTAPVRVSDDRWVLDGCPENGPSLAVDARRRVHVVWPTLVASANPSSEPTLELFYAMSADGRRFSRRQRIASEGAARHPVLALGSRGDLVIAWDEPVAGRRRIAMAHGTVDDKGTAAFARRTLDDAASATYPSVATTGENAVVAWTSGSPTAASVVRVARVRF
jgi:hypothetical protein